MGLTGQETLQLPLARAHAQRRVRGPVRMRSSDHAGPRDSSTCDASREMSDL
ncbi:hypothetical protein WN48_07985 [Eufriesea mexicana]|uniref:Uncharacterized protein n=1 Tax=Eufriesea mexicana TaxID=516756 RepID=A0A310STN0_9HYME|nr:hypothetical protein WN48_07985 [Eufriesea mexicana]